MWIELVKERFKEHEFKPGATVQGLDSAEATLGVALPEDLRDLLLESDGIVGPTGVGLIWTLDRIVSANLEFRSLTAFRDQYMPFEPLLFFGDEGNGDQFAFIILNGVIRYRNVFVWNHEDDSRFWVAGGLRRYLEWRATRPVNS